MKNITIPELPPPTGKQIREFITRNDWTLAKFAEVVGLNGQRATLKAINEEHKLNNARWTIALLAAGEHPTLKLVETREGSASH